MNLHILPVDVLAFIKQANIAGISHSFVEAANPSTDALVLHWEPQAATPDLTIILNKDGTWHAAIELPAVGE